MLKVGFDGDEESAQEALALQHWGGEGAVRLLRADPHRRALLLERLHHQDLSGGWDLADCEVIARLYARLHRPAPARLRRLTEVATGWLAGLAALPREAPIPHRYVDHALAAGRALLDEPGSALLHGDLHFGNVLAADREPWLAIDPKPLAGDPNFEPAPVLWNRWADLVATGSLRTAIRSRFETVVDVAGLDEDRARDWVVVRMVLNAAWSLTEPDQQAAEQWRTRCIAVTKAVLP